MAPDAAAEDAGWEPPHLDDQVALALRLRAGLSEVLVVLFVALIRAMGLPVRYVRLMDVLPMEPWKRRPAVSVSSRSTMSPKEAQEREARLRRNQQQQQQPATQQGKTSSDVEDITQSMEKKRRLATGGKAGGGKISRVSPPAAVPSGGPPESVGGSVPRNRGEEELERQIQLAMMATEAEALARQVKGRKVGVAGPAGSGPGASAVSVAREGPSEPKARSDLLQGRGVRRGRGAWGGAKGAGKGKSSTGAPALSPAAGPLVWAEVYCGSVDTGKWIHVDVVCTGSVNRWDNVVNGLGHTLGDQGKDRVHCLHGRWAGGRWAGGRWAGGRDGMMDPSIESCSIALL